MRNRARSIGLTSAVLLVLLASAFLAAAVAAIGGPSAAAVPSAADRPTAPVGALASAPASGDGAPHGDLVVGPANSPYYLTPAVAGGTVYVQAGNITVLPGGELIVENLTLSFLQFIPSSGNAGARASHLANFTVEGLVRLDHSTLTTDTSVLDAFVRLTVNITGDGSFEAQSSQLAFPGAIVVDGPGAQFLANDSQILPNPGVAGLVENRTVQADTSYAPVLLEENGADVTLLQSSYTGYYADNPQANGMPGVNLSSIAGGELAVNGTLNLTPFSLPAPLASSTASALAYPAYTSGYAEFSYFARNGSTLRGLSVSYLGVSYPVAAAIRLPATHTNSTPSLWSEPLPAAFLAAVAANGQLTFLQASGAYGGPASLAVNLTGPNASVKVTAANLVLDPTLIYNYAISGGSTFTAADSFLDANWAALPGTAVDPGVPVSEPWQSTKFLLSGGSRAFFANVSVPTAYGTVFDNQSFVVPTDPSSSAYIYRWAEIQAESGAFGPIPGVHVQAFPAYNESDAANATSLAANDLPALDPALAAYVADLRNGEGAAVGITGASGTATMLLASDVISAATLPTGSFVGSYHLGSSLPGFRGNGTVWSYGSVAAYPTGMSPSAASLLPTAPYPDYRAELAIGPVRATVNNLSSNGTVAIGQQVEFSVSITNVGTAALENFTANLSLLAPSPFPAHLLAPELRFGTLNASATQNVSFRWVVNESVIGTGGSKNETFEFASSWNGGAAPIGGTTQQFAAMTVVPAYIALSFSPPVGPLTVGESYVGEGTVTFAGAGLAEINVSLIAPTGASYLVGSGGYGSGRPFSQEIGLGPGIAPGTTYTLLVTASYNGRTVSRSYSGIETAGVPPPPPSFWDQKVLGLLPLWLLVVLIVVVLAALIAFLVVSGRLSRGKLVECGECGALIPETDTVCPKCGAEFETELVRCSRCGSTIPAGSESCPECAAQLRGPPVPEAKDPERQGFADFVQRFRGEAKKELGDNYGEGAFWDWWKRQPTFVAFSQWKMQQASGSRAGMGAPVVSPAPVEFSEGPAPTAPEAAPVPEPARATPPRRPPAAAPGTSPAPAGRRAAAAPAPAPEAASSAGPEGPGLKACSNCGKEIPTDFLVCPFCGAVTH